MILGRKSFVDLSFRRDIPRRRISFPRRALLIVAPCIAFCLAFVSFAACKKGEPRARGPVRVGVLTQNLFFGDNLLGLARFSARGKSPRALLRKARKLTRGILRNIRFHDFPARARGIAAKIALLRPDAIGLQEAFLIRERRGLPGGWTVRHDYLKELQSALKRKNLSYTVAAVLENTDEEIPLDGRGSALRITDRLAVLVGPGVRVRSQKSGRFRNVLRKNLVLRTISFPRGYIKVDLEKSGRVFRLITTHLERLGRYKYEQNEELLRLFEKPDRPQLIAGDFNVDPGRGPGMYRDWRRRHYDAWEKKRGKAKGGTCCFRIPLTDRRHFPGSRFDLIFATEEFHPLRVKRVYARVDSRVPRPKKIWTSDHAGLFAELELR